MYNLYIFVWGCFTNMVFALALSDSVINKEVVVYLDKKDKKKKK